MGEIVRAVKALKVADENGVAIPADWPNNDLIKDRVILPTASNMKDAEARKGKEGCYDWWFCHKELK
jgi:peroxiredoxin (alkyl hydroperoxide reductase subunit C)